MNNWRKILSWKIVEASMKVYRVGEANTDRFYITDEASLEGWRRYLGKYLEVEEIFADELFIPGTDIKFRSWQQLQTLLDRNPRLESRIFPEESGLQNLAQFEIYRSTNIRGGDDW